MMLLNRAGLRFEKWGKASEVYLGSLSYLFGEEKIEAIYETNRTNIIEK